MNCRLQEKHGDRLSDEVPTYISGSGFVVGVAARSVPQRAGWFDS